MSAALRPAAWILLITAVLKTHADPDLWGHVRFGLDMIRDRALVSHDPYSFTQDVPWINHEWLSELAMGAAFHLGGSLGLTILKGIVVAGALVLVAGALRRRPDWIRWPALCLAVWGVLPLTSTVRPQLWTLLLLAVLLGRLDGPPRRLWTVPILFVFWANLHGGWLVGFGVLAVWCAVRALDQAPDRPSLGMLALIPAISLCATLINPYGWGLWEFLASTVRLSRADIGEWQPIWRDSVTTQVQWLATLVFVGMMIKSGIRADRARMAVVVLLALASLQVNRLVPLFIVAAVMLCAGSPATAPRVVVPLSRTIIDISAVAIAVIAAVWLGAIPRCVTMVGEWMPDTAAARALGSAAAHGRLITWFDWGEYAIWHLSPALRVSIDGRRETVYSERTLQEQFAIAAGAPEGLAALERISPEYVWLPSPHGDRTAAWLVDHGYRLDVQTSRSFVAVRADLPRVMPVATAGSDCFPGP
jgi:hypothetical protein